MRSRVSTPLRLLALLGALACGDEPGPKPEPAAFAWPDGPLPHAVVHVKGLGAIELELHPRLAPATVENFTKLAEQGFYDGTTFHRVIPGFMIQGGDPNTKDRDPSDDGLGGPGYQIADEISDAPHERGVISMANVGRPNTGGSQFFIMLADRRALDRKYTVFGRVVSGIEVVDAIAAVEVDPHGRWGPKNRPIESVVVERIEIRPAAR